MLIYVTRVCPRCGNKFTFRFSYSTIPPQFCDNCTRELILKTEEEEMLTENICCNCHWYEGVKAVPGTAPCSKHNKQVLWNEDCDEIWLIPERLKVEKREPIMSRRKHDGGICAIRNESDRSGGLMRSIPAE